MRQFLTYFFLWEKKLKENSLFNRIYNFSKTLTFQFWWDSWLGNVAVVTHIAAGCRRVWIALIFSEMNGFSMCAYVHVEASLQSRNLSSTMISKLKFILARSILHVMGWREVPFRSKSHDYALPRVFHATHAPSRLLCIYSLLSARCQLFFISGSTSHYFFTKKETFSIPLYDLRHLGQYIELTQCSPSILLPACASDLACVEPLIGGYLDLILLQWLGICKD